jgi:hypothetical protein
MYVLSRPCARSSGRYYQVTLQYGAGKARLAYQVQHGSVDGTAGSTHGMGPENQDTVLLCERW